MDPLLDALRQLLAARVGVPVERIGPDAWPRRLLDETELSLWALDVEVAFDVEIAPRELNRLKSLGDWLVLVRDRSAFQGSGVA